MSGIYTKNINSEFFKEWSSEMSYVLGYIVADGCISVSKDRKNHPYSLNITSKDLEHLCLLKSAMDSGHKISQKNKKNNIAYQIQFRNHIITENLINLGVHPRKTYNLKPINVPDEYFSDFVRGFFDGDGTVYIYKVNGVSQIKSGFVSVNLEFIEDFNKRLCKKLNISEKNIHEESPKRSDQNLCKYCIDFYIDDSQKLADFIYGNNPKLYLSRKREVFEKWKSIKRRHYIKKDYPSKIGWQLKKQGA